MGTGWKEVSLCIRVCCASDIFRARLQAQFRGSNASPDSAPKLFSIPAGCFKSYATAVCANCRYLDENSLDGKIPTELGLLTSLTEL